VWPLLLLSATVVATLAGAAALAVLINES